jgi:hypothetical protein
MDFDTLSKLALAALPVIGGGFQLARGQRGARKRLKEDLELLALMPDGSDVRATMLKHLDDQVRGLATKDDELRRDPTGIGMGLVFLVASVVLGYFAVTGSGWWWLASFLVALIGTAGLASSAAKKARDEKGRIIR